jgi:hypothetical protein
MFNTRQDLAFGGTIRSEFVGHDHPGHVAQTLQQLAKETFGRLRVPSALDQHIEYIPVLINGPPEVVQFASDADKHLIQKLLVAGLRPPHLEAVGVSSSEAQAPFTDCLVADHDASRRQDCLVAERCWDQVRCAIEEYAWRFDGLRRRAPHRRRT